MIIIPIPAFTDNYIWLLIETNQKLALCIDPGDANPVISYLEENHLTLNTVLLTHHHYDHINGLSALLKYNPKITVYGPNDPRVTSSYQIICDQELVTIQSHKLQFHVLDTPGHTSTHICFYESNLGLLFCGDTLFSAGCGRIFDGSPELLHASLNKLKDLPGKTLMYCGHEYTRQNLRFAAIVEPDNLAIQNYQQTLMKNPSVVSLPSTIVLERSINPFLRLSEPQVKCYAHSKGCNDLEPLSIFKQLRKEKNNFV